MCRWICVVFAILLLPSCATKPEPPSASPAPPQVLITAQKRQPPYLNVNIAAFTNDTQGTGRLNRIYAPVREVEASYLPVLLRNALDDSGLWGAVRVAPGPNPSAEVQVTARILKSTALELKLHVDVKDSRGTTWLDKDYDDKARGAIYADGNNIGDDAFQNLFIQIANDMYKVRAGLSQDTAGDITRAALLRYADTLSPQSFSRYLSTDSNGIVEVKGLPAQNDKMYLRVKKIRAVEYKFEDVMDEEYSRYYEKLRSVYPYWQRYSYELLSYNNHINSTDSVSGEKRRAGSWDATVDVYDTFKEYKLNEDELRELATSFKSETHRTALELEGHVIELKGPLTDQYRQWRKILSQIYTEER